MRIQIGILSEQSGKNWKILKKTLFFQKMQLRNIYYFQYCSSTGENGKLQLQLEDKDSRKQKQFEWSSLIRTIWCEKTKLFVNSWYFYWFFSIQSRWRRNFWGVAEFFFGQSAAIDLNFPTHFESVKYFKSWALNLQKTKIFRKKGKMDVVKLCYRWWLFIL